MAINRLERDAKFGSKREKQTFETLEKAGMVMQGTYDRDGEKTTITFADSTTGTRREIPVTARLRNIDGIMHTAYMPSRRDMRDIRRSIVTG